MQSRQMKKNKGSALKASIKKEKDVDHDAQQGVLNSMNSSKIIDFIIMSLENNKEGNRNERQKGKEQQCSFEEKSLEKQQQEEDIKGEFDHTLMKENTNNKAEDGRLNKIPESMMFKSLYDLCKVIIQNEISGEHGGSKTTKDQEDSIKEKLPDEQQQGITGGTELNEITGEDNLANNLDRVLDNNDSNRGSKLLIRDENDGNYRITQGIPKSIKFRCINNLYKCTVRLSPVEDEYIWKENDSSEDFNMNRLKKEDSSDKENSGGEGKIVTLDNFFQSV